MAISASAIHFAISATLKYRKLNERYTKWALAENYAPVPVIDVARDSMLLPVNVMPPVPVANTPK